MRIKKGDTVQIISGKDKGKKGRVLRVMPEEDKLIIEGLNLFYKHVRPRRQGEKGQRIQFPASLHVSKVMLICPKCSKSIRIGYKILADGEKVRYCRKCKEII